MLIVLLLQQIIVVLKFQSCSACSPNQTSTRWTSTYPTDTHTPYLAIVQTKEFTGHALWIATTPGSSSLMLLGMFCVGTAYTVIVRQTSGYTPAIGEEESDASRLQGLKSFFFVTIVPFFVSIMFVLRKDRGTLHRGKGDMH